MAALTNKQVLVVALLAVLLVSKASAAITCGQVGSNLVSCLPYMIGRGTLNPGCCNGLRSLNSLVSTSADRQAACRCINSLANTISSLILGAIY
jgi:hypothetical protein